MPDERSATRTSWRPARADAARRRVSGPRWRRDAEGAGTPGWGGARATRIIAGLVGFAACYGLLIWAVSWLRPPRPAGLFLVRAGYLANPAIPPNAFGLNGIDVLARLPVSGDPARDGKRTGIGAIAGPFDLRSDTPWDGGLDILPGKTAVVFVAAHGAADGRGPFLYRDAPDFLSRPRAERGFPTAKVYVRDMIRDLAGRADRRFVLILDATQATVVEATGQVCNDFVGGVRGLEKEIREAGNLVILLPGDQGQRSWVAEPWRQTVFCHFVAQGLAGLAKDSGGRIHARGLADYVGREVENWSLTHRGEPQSPILLPSGDRARDFELATAPLEATPSPPSPEVAPILKELSQAWEDRWKAHDKLSQKSPPPWSWNPVRWRAYRDRLLRYDALVRAARPGAPRSRALAFLTAGLDEDEMAMKQPRLIPLRSSRNSLAMPAVEGRVSAAPDASDRALFNRLWSGPAPGAGEVAEGPPAIDPKDRVAFLGLLIRQVEEGTDPGDLARAGRLLGSLREPDRPLPAEAHFLAILARDLPPKTLVSPESRQVVGRALAVRRLAEAAAAGASDDGPSFAERVAPAIQGIVAEADEARRRAEDLLLVVDNPARREEIERGLARAEAGYRDARARADAIREALAARDRAFADLPYYSTWAAHRPDGPEARETIATLERTWAAAHSIAAASLPADAGSAAKLREAGALVGDGLKGIKAQFDAEVTQWLNHPLPVGGHATILAMLETPFLSFELREKMAQKMDSDPVLADVPAVTTPPSASLAAEAGRRAARMAMAALGDLRPGGRARLDVPGTPALADDEVSTSATLGDLALLGDRIGESRALLRAAIPARLAEGLLTPLDSPPDALRDSDHLARLLVAGESAGADDPSEACRLGLLRRLLLRQARRALDDHWFAENDDPEAPPDRSPTPYYRAAGSLFLDDLRATDLPQKDRAPGSELARVEAAMAVVDRIVVEGPRGPLIVTDEKRLDVRYRLSAPPGPGGSPGRPVVGIEVDDASLRVDLPRSGAREDVPIDPPRAGGGTTPSLPVSTRTGPFDARFVGQLGIPRVEQAAREPAAVARPELVRSSFRLEGRYRGQVIRSRTPVEVHPVPEIVAVRPPLPTSGEVVLRADPGLVTRFGDNEDGGLAIVLDCSASLGARDGEPPEASKYREMTDAVREVLGQVTRGTWVSLWVFGEAIEPGRVAVPPERSILRVLRPTRWNPDDPSQLADVMKMITYPALVPFNRSPIVRTMIRARADLAGVRGFKSMIVLTDGMDNCFAQEAAPAGGEKPDVAEAIRREFAGSDIEINVVGYKAAGVEEAIRQQFGAIKELPRPGHFYWETEAGALGATLAQALRPTLRYSIQSTDNLRVTGGKVEGRARPGDREFRGLAPKGYKLVVEAGGRVEKNLKVNRGDRLIVRVDERDGEVTMRRSLLADDLLSRPPSKEAEGWRFSALGSRKEGAGVSLSVALEKLPDRDETELEMIRPRDVWIEARPGPGPASQVPFSQKWGYRGPFWEVTSPSWPEDPATGRPASPLLRAWWNPDREAEAAAVVSRAEMPSPEEVRDLRVPTDRGPVVVESLAVEEFAMMTPSGEKKELRLVVRLAHTEGEPFWVRLLGITTTWSEHRFYTGAGKVTSSFWPVTRDQVNVSLEALGLISVSQFKERARLRGFAVEGVPADTPGLSGDAGPAPIDDGAKPLPGPTILR